MDLDFLDCFGREKTPRALDKREYLMINEG